MVIQAMHILHGNFQNYREANQTKFKSYLYPHYCKEIFTVNILQYSILILLFFSNSACFQVEDLDQWFSIRNDLTLLPLPSHCKRYLTVSGDIFGCHNLERCATNI